MALSAWQENVLRRTKRATLGGYDETRVYNAPQGTELPSPGDAPPGETPTLLGPVVITIPERKETKNGFAEITLICRTFEARS
jgi:hypothetical protein